MTSWGTLQVRTAQDLKYIRIPSFKRFSAVNPGLKNIPIQIIPWLFTKWSIFSAILKSPYWGNCFSRSQHQQPFIYRTKTARKKSILSVVTILSTCDKRNKRSNLARDDDILKKIGTINLPSPSRWAWQVLVQTSFPSTNDEAFFEFLNLTASTKKLEEEMFQFRKYKLQMKP